jgi:hypothetical protein
MHEYWVCIPQFTQPNSRISVVKTEWYNGEGVVDNYKKNGYYKSNGLIDFNPFTRLKSFTLRVIKIKL